eukprot:TRINITY_DN6225_c0_g1_i3.p1 TRINITY_DN6225_c0_g1~~TRINITY_DN6225_c0_g1_i3.p1  ORF type:complete len:290 (+),score=85.36 TRINITY_DN6225_c0_g1_i3:156-1025(+)
MMKSAFVLLGLISYTLAQQSCPGVSISQNIRTQWQENGVNHYLYDLSITNNYETSVSDLVFNLVSAAGNDLTSAQGSSFTQMWNIVQLASTNPKTIPFTLVEPRQTSSYSLFPGQTYRSAGYVVRADNTNLGASVTCNRGSSSSDSASASASDSASASGSDSASGSASASDSDSGSASASSSEGTPSCSVSATIAKDANTWTDAQGRSSAVWRVTLTNTGSKPLKHYVTSFGLYGGEQTSSWNLQGSLGGFEVVGFGESLAPGQSYSGAGIIVAGNTQDVVLTPYGSAC